MRSVGSYGMSGREKKERRKVLDMLSMEPWLVTKRVVVPAASTKCHLPRVSGQSRLLTKGDNKMISEASI